MVNSLVCLAHSILPHTKRIVKVVNNSQEGKKSFSYEKLKKIFRSFEAFGIYDFFLVYMISWGFVLTFRMFWQKFSLVQNAATLLFVFTEKTLLLNWRHHLNLLHKIKQNIRVVVNNVDRQILLTLFLFLSLDVECILSTRILN